MAQYLPIFFMTVLAVAFGAGQVALARVMGPNNPNNAKMAPYECGIVPTKAPPERFPVRFYLVAMIFIVFDVEVIFLYPYVIMYRSLGVFGLVEIAIFSVAVISCLIFLLANGALDWGPRDLVKRPIQVEGSRSTSSSTRLVGSEGRDPNREVAA